MQDRTWAQNNTRLPQQRIKPPIQVFSKMPECQAQGQRSLQWSLLHRIFEYAVGGRLLGFKAVSLIIAMIWHGLISVLSKASIAARVLGGAPRFAHVPLSRCFSLGGSLPLAVGHLAMASGQWPRPLRGVPGSKTGGHALHRFHYRKGPAQKALPYQSCATIVWATAHEGVTRREHSNIQPSGGSDKTAKKGRELVRSISKTCSSMILMVAHMNVAKKSCKVICSIKAKLWVGVLNWQPAFLEILEHYSKITWTKYHFCSCLQILEHICEMMTYKVQRTNALHSPCSLTHGIKPLLPQTFFPTPNNTMPAPLAWKGTEQGFLFSFASM